MKTFVVNTVRTAQITRDSLMPEVLKALSGREQFSDTTELHEVVYNGDVFEAILIDNEGGAEPLNEDAMKQITDLASEVGEYEYVMITAY